VLETHFRHLVEETGEIARCFRGRGDEPLDVEAIDAANCALGLCLLYNNADFDRLCQKMDEKLDKWQRNINSLVEGS